LNSTPKFHAHNLWSPLLKIRSLCQQNYKKKPGATCILNYSVYRHANGHSSDSGYIPLPKISQEAVGLLYLRTVFSGFKSEYNLLYETVNTHGPFRYIRKMIKNTSLNLMIKIRL